MSSPYNTFSYYTFGCKVNFADTCTISRQLIGEGFSEVKIDAEADIYIVNTCSVTENANKKARRFINKLHKRSPNSKIIVTGCYAQLNPEELSDIPGVSNVINAQNKFNIKSYINYDNRKNIISDINGVNNFISSYSINERTRAFLKIQDGCDYTCSYCTIPMARGKSRSANIEDTVLKVEEIVHKGINEIVLCGINVGDYGMNNNESLIELLKQLEEIKELKRYRISSIEPNLLSKEIIQFVSESSKALPHLHIPLQSGSNRILKSMKRRYTTKDYENLINHINNCIPNICLGVDVIVGYPGETDRFFNETYNFIEKLNISYLHVFSYSDRSNTVSSTMNSKISMEDKNSRRKLLQNLSNEKYNNFITKNVKQIKEVLFENYNQGFVDGLSDNYIRVYAKGNKSLLNSIKQVKILENNINTYGKIIN